jgi:calcium-dependent protein kinase
MLNLIFIYNLMGACNTINVKENISSNLIAKNKTFSDFIVPKNLVSKGKIQNKYIITEEFLGRGASGIVSLAKDKTGKKQYAIKTVNKLQIHNFDFIKSECELSLLLNHPHITKCYEIYEDSKTISFILEFIEGGDLLEYLSNLPEHKTSDYDALNIIIQILETVNYLHNEKKIAHRDLKLENFLVIFDKNKKPIIKLSDFGFSCLIPNDGLMNEHLGTPIYNAPEILLRRKYNCKCDIWSVGVILFNLLTGYQPFSTENEDEMDNEELTKDINFTVINNKQLKQLCMKMLEKDPKIRWNAKDALNFAKKIDLKNEVSSNGSTNDI